MEINSVNEFGDGVAWYRGAMVGKGSFGCVYLATLKNQKLNYSYLPTVMAVKSAEVSISGSIQKEREVLNNIKGCPYIIRCFGDETTTGKNGAMVYNLLLEYGSGGTLAERIEKFGSNGLCEFEVRNHTRSMLRGLNYIHDIGYVHCDMKPDNILLVPNSNEGKKSTEFKAKIGDLGLAKREKVQSKKRRLEPYWRGTPMYLSPEAVSDNVQECPADIWALGCIVLEMLTGKPPWDRKEDNAEDVLRKIGGGHELPRIPENLSKEAKDFLKGCFVRNPRYRWTAEMLLTHPFVDGLIDDEGVEQPQEVEDINVIDSILLVTESDDELAYYSEDWSYASEDESLGYWSEEDYEEIEDEMTSYFAEEGIFKVEKSITVISSTIDGGSDHILDPSVKVPSGSPSNNSSKCPLSITIPAGV
ncbi:mitogen-activated protein kinase kinase kinase 20-like [Lycium ferocissimum]|uniref:mitogen-activated protein kinase kinase kinase 20-like n=1 Tax=Lycium ferocissimum TaxID=112874 RepID=UPI002815FE67|nr:mitogen-activated protein kinase kinase kinase 20-like [Lycium ferocissimum]